MLAPTFLPMPRPIRYVFSLLVVLLSGAACAAEVVVPPPQRLPDGPGAPRFHVAGTPAGQTELRAEAGANPPLEAEGDWLIGPAYAPAVETREDVGVPHGRLVQFTLHSADSQFYPGIARDAFGTVDPANPLTLVVKTHPAPYGRQITVYVPARYAAGTEAPFLVSHDGPKEAGWADNLLVHTLDNLIAQHRVPAMVAIMIANGGGDAQGSERGLEYDTMSGKFAEFIEAEVLPAVQAHAEVRLTHDPDGRAVMGGSSGAAAAFTMAWYHPEWYHRVISYSGTYINQQWPYDPVTPGGAWEYHNRLIAASEPKPIRIWLQVSDRDLFNPNVLRDGMHDWVMANHRMAAVLRDRGYHYQYVFSLNSYHVDSRVRAQTLPEALEWVWRGYGTTPAGAGPRP